MGTERERGTHLLCNVVPILLSIGADAHLAAGCSAGSCPAAGALDASGLNQVLPELGFWKRLLSRELTAGGGLWIAWKKRVWQHSMWSCCIAA